MVKVSPSLMEITLPLMVFNSAWDNRKKINAKIKFNDNGIDLGGAVVLGVTELEFHTALEDADAGDFKKIKEISSDNSGSGALRLKVFCTLEGGNLWFFYAKFNKEKVEFSYPEVEFIDKSQESPSSTPAAEEGEEERAASTPRVGFSVVGELLDGSGNPIDSFA